MDQAVVVRAPEDLYAFANGGWLRSAKIPADKASVSVGSEIGDHTAKVLRKVCEDAARSRRPLSTAEGRVGLMIRLGNDAARAERLGVSPLREELRRIDAIRSRNALMRGLARLAGLQFNLGADYLPLPGIGAMPYPDDKNADRLLFTFGQSGLSYRTVTSTLARTPEQRPRGRRSSRARRGC